MIRGVDVLTLKGFWYIAAPGAELARLPIRRSVEGELLVLYRDSTGTPHALLDRCSHRGMTLSAGRVEGDCLRCPYHGWTYDGTGRLREVPALGPGTPPRVRGPRPFPVAESDGHLWVWIGDEGPAREPFRFPHAEDAGWSSFFMHTRFAAPVDLCLENFLDVPHTMFVHPGLFRGSEARPTRAAVLRSREGVEARFFEEAPLEGWGPRLVFPRGTRMEHSDRFLLPSITRVDYGFGEAGGVTITSQCTQRGEYEVDVTTAIAWSLPLPAWIAGPFLRWYCARVIRQDVELLRVQGEQVRRFGRDFAHTPADLLGRHIASLRRSAAEGRTADGVREEEAIVRI